MKKNIFNIIAISFFLLFVASCDDDATNLGIEIQPTQDEIAVKTDVFRLKTETFPIDQIISKPDSFLLGTYIDDIFGITESDILTQVLVAKKGYTFMDNQVAKTTPDSVVLTIGFNSFFGVNSSPMKIDVYEMNKSLDFKKDYLSDIDADSYVNLSQPIGSLVTTVLNPITKRNNKEIKIKLKDDFLNRFFTTDANIYKSQENFLNHLKGLYITTKSFGSSTILNVNKVILTLHFHYKYLDGDKKDDIVKTYLNFPVNSEVKSVNRIKHTIRKEDAEIDKEYNYIVSPANYYTKIKIPVKEIKERLGSGKFLDVNGAKIKLNLLEGNYGSQIPNVTDLLLVKESEMDNFFKNNQLPNDSTAWMSPLLKERISNDKYKYYYSFPSLNKFIKKELEKENSLEKISFVLVPVTAKYRVESVGYYNTRKVLTELRQDMRMHATTIFSGDNTKEPMVLELVYSNF